MKGNINFTEFVITLFKEIVSTTPFINVYAKFYLQSLNIIHQLNFEILAINEQTKCFISERANTQNSSIEITYFDLVFA